MIIKYFKTKMWGDCYVVEDNYMNILSISKKDAYIMADDENIFEGPYKEINIKENSFKKMKLLAIQNKRKDLTELLKKAHKNNENLLDISKNPFIKIKTINSEILTRNEKLEKSSYLRSYFFKTKSILN